MFVQVPFQAVMDDNYVKQAVEMVQPFGPDLCSSMRTKEKLDVQKLRDFLKAIKN